MTLNSRKPNKFTDRSTLSRPQDMLLLILTKFVSMLLTIKNVVQAIWTRSKNSFISFPIKQKLSIIIGLIVIVVIFVLSLILTTIGFAFYYMAVAIIAFMAYLVLADRKERLITKKERNRYLLLPHPLMQKIYDVLLRNAFLF